MGANSAGPASLSRPAVRHIVRRADRLPQPPRPCVRRQISERLIRDERRDEPVTEQCATIIDPLFAARYHARTNGVHHSVSDFPSSFISSLLICSV